MRVTREIGFFSLLVLATLFVQNASAALIYLPDSSYAEAEDNWQGSRIYKEDDFYVLIDFTVYDTQNLLSSEEIAFAEELNIAGRYIYAYQIFNHPDALEEVGYFEIFGIGEPPLDVYADSIGALSDSDDPNTEGIEPTDKYFNTSHTRGTWLFSADYGHGSILSGEHSWFLVFGSNFAPIPGSYEIKVPEEGESPVPPEVPEPATLILLGIGGALIFTRRRKSIQ